jgi:hypothetical protein
MNEHRTTNLDANRWMDSDYSVQSQRLSAAFQKHQDSKGSGCEHNVLLGVMDSQHRGMDICVHDFPETAFV